ncbi:MAG: hypothetical protein HY762_03245 [Planctomycetes bacterium]|nr:hypothetical protein [Planctomycetota bacterium]
MPRMNDDNFFNWQGKLVNMVVVNAVAWGIPAPAVAGLVARRAQYEPLYHKAQEKDDRTRGDVDRHRQARKIYQKELEVFANPYIRFNDLVPRDNKIEMGVPPRDMEPTPVPPEYVANLEPPVLLLNWSKRGQVTVHFGVNPTNEKLNAKPVNIAGAKIWYRIESGPWVWVADDTNSPYTHNLAITEPLNVEYRAQWFDKKIRLGPFGETAKCTVSP